MSYVWAFVEHFDLTFDFVSSGMIRLPKATKAPVKSRVIPRQSLANIVKDLGKNKQRFAHRNVLQFGGL